MAKVFQVRFPAALDEAGLCIPKRVPKQWIVDCSHVGKGITALKYLSRYLYRNVISEKNIVSNQNGQVTFRYTESNTGNICFRTLKGEDFLSLIMQHVLPKGFRRVRDYGFLHIYLTGSIISLNSRLSFGRLRCALCSFSRRSSCPTKIDKLAQCIEPEWRTYRDCKC
jgi:hypothetical protein